MPIAVNTGSAVPDVGVIIGDGCGATIGAEIKLIHLRHPIAPTRGNGGIGNTIHSGAIDTVSDRLVGPMVSTVGIGTTRCTRSKGTLGDRSGGAADITDQGTSRVVNGPITSTPPNQIEGRAGRVCIQDETKVREGNRR
jgi:hypothetical protein